MKLDFISTLLVVIANFGKSTTFICIRTHIEAVKFSSFADVVVIVILPTHTQKNLFILGNF
jgi:hypothetical protein